MSMETVPFNACDYRCERCLETEQSAVFRDPSEVDAHNFAVGRETDGLEAELWDGEDIIAATEEMLLEKAEEFDIDLDELADAGPREVFEKAKKDPLYQRSDEFMMNMRDLLKRIEPLITPQGKENYRHSPLKTRYVLLVPE